MAGERLPLHGRDHRKGGCDPIEGLGGIQFDIDNIGDWLDVETSLSSPHGFGLRFTDTSAGGIDFSATSDFLVGANTVTLNSAGSASSLQLGTTASVSSTGSITLTSGDEVVVSTLGMDVTATSGNINLTDTTATGTINFKVDQSGQVNVILVPNGGATVFNVLRFGSAIPAFQIRDDNSVHIRTGTSVIADL